MSETSVWDAFSEHPQMLCVAAPKLADALKSLAKTAKEREIDFAHALTVHFWEDDGRWTVNLLY